MFSYLHNLLGVLQLAAIPSQCIYCVSRRGIVPGKAKQLKILLKLLSSAFIFRWVFFFLKKEKENPVIDEIIAAGACLKIHQKLGRVWSCPPALLSRGCPGAASHSEGFGSSGFGTNGDFWSSGVWGQWGLEAVDLGAVDLGAVGFGGSGV